jgi:hypothetical protein
LIFLSKFQSSTAKSFGGKIKEISIKDITPGPGTYKAFSEFGYNYDNYDSRFSNKLKNSNSEYDKNGIKNKNKSKKEFKKSNINININKEDNNNKEYLRYFQIREEVKFNLI